MPLVKIDCTGSLSELTKREIISDLSKACARIMSKPEAYVMSVIRDGMLAFMAGKEEPCAFVEVRGIGGFSPEVNNKLSKAICDCISTHTGINPSCIYINFIDISPTNWGWNGKTFA